MAEGSDLTAEQTEKLLQFQDLTGTESMDSCREILERHNWDMEVAVQDTFNEREGAPGVFTETRREEPRAPQVHMNPRDQRVYTVARPAPRGLLGWGYFVVMFPFRFVYTTIFDLLRFAFRLVRPDPRRHVTDPLGDVMAFISYFDQHYGPLHPTFYQGTYSQALNDAKKELKFLLVYLHGDDHQDSPGFCRDTLCDPSLYEYVNSNMLFWACNTNSPEGYRVSQALRENTYPFLAVIVLRDNKMTVVARIEGPIRPTDLTERLQRITQDNESSLTAARVEREERNFNIALRVQQDEAYQESLRADQEKERKKREEIEKKEAEEEAERQKELDEQRRLEEIAERKVVLRGELPQEPAEDSPDTICVVLKLPDGTRLDRRFVRNQSLKHLYNFVFCHEDAPDDFQISQNFPRKTLPCQPSEEVPEPPSFEEVGLGKKEMLFVHDNEA